MTYLYIEVTMKKEILFKKHFNIDKPLKLVCMVLVSLLIIAGLILLAMGFFWFSLETLVLAVPAFIWLLRYSPQHN